LESLRNTGQRRRLESCRPDQLDKLLVIAGKAGLPAAETWQGEHSGATEQN